MKRSIIILIVLFSIVMANPIMTVDAYLSELSFNQNGTWRLELFYDFFDSYGAFPWFFKYTLETNEGRSNIMFHDSTLEYFEITNDNLDQDLIINPCGDSIKLNAYYDDPDSPYFTDYLVIGEEDGSYIMNIENGQSISRLSGEYYYMYRYDLFYKGDSSTIGLENDTSKAKGYIYGYAYDYDGSILSNRRIWLEDGIHDRIETNDHGYFCSRILSRSYVLDRLWVQDLIEESGENLVFSPIYFDLEPGDSVRIDFHQIETSIKPVIKNDIIKLNNYPHPASSYTWVYIDNTDVEASAMRVNVYALNGRKVDSFVPTAKHFRYDCGHLPQGSYVLTLNHGHEMLASKKLQILK